MQLINIGFGNLVSSDRIIAIVTPEPAPIRRILQEAKEKCQIIDVTHGRKKRAAIITDTGYVILSPIQPETVASRFDKEEKTLEN